MSGVYRKMKWAFAGFVAVAIFALAINPVWLWAASTQSGLTPQLDFGSPPSTVNRSRKGDRIRPVPAIKTALPIGCDPSVSSLAKAKPFGHHLRLINVHPRSQQQLPDKMIGAAAMGT
jgi:hypothetical protein